MPLLTGVHIYEMNNRRTFSAGDEHDRVLAGNLQIARTCATNVRVAVPADVENRVLGHNCGPRKAKDVSVFNRGFRVTVCNFGLRNRQAATQKQRAEREDGESRAHIAIAEQGIRQTCLSSHFGTIGQQTPAADEAFPFINRTYTRPETPCKPNSTPFFSLPASRELYGVGTKFLHYLALSGGDAAGGKRRAWPPPCIADQLFTPTAT